MKQELALLEYLKVHGSITSIEAIHRLHMTRLAEYISRLIKSGYNIEKVTEKGQTVDGRASHWTRYYLR